MKLIMLSVSPMQENVYIYYDENTHDAVVVDPGGDYERICKILEDNKLAVKAILLTHGHFDHIMAVNKIKNKTGAKIVANPLEEIILGDCENNFSKHYSSGGITIEIDLPLNDGEAYSFGACSLQLIHTPGHTPGGSCYYDVKAGVLFSGDTLFHESIGRSDFPYGDANMLVEAIKTKLCILPDGVKVYPGHGEPTSIGHEKTRNYYLK